MCALLYIPCLLVLRTRVGFQELVVYMYISEHMPESSKIHHRCFILQLQATTVLHNSTK